MLVVLSSVSAELFSGCSAVVIVVVVKESEITLLIIDSKSLIGMLLPSSSCMVISTEHPLMNEIQRKTAKTALSFFTIFPPRSNA